MLEIHWDLLPGDGEVSDFTLGDLTLRGAHGTVTTRGTLPRRSMMVFPTIVDFLGGVLDLLVQGRPGCTLMTCASSFEVMLTRSRDGRIVVKVGRAEIDTVSQAELVRAFWDGAQEVLGVHRDAAGMNGADLASVEARFKVTFGL